MKKGIIFAFYGICLVIFTGYVLLDTFMFTDSYQVVTTQTNVVEHKPALNEKIVTTDDYYKDNNIEIKIEKARDYGTQFYIADIKISDIEYLKSAFAKDTFGKNITDKVSKTAKAHNAILAINGDFYGVQTKGYVLRNYNIYRTTGRKGREDLVIYKNGKFDSIYEVETSIDSLIGAKEILSFGPSLIKDGKIVISKKSDVPREYKNNPRTVIAQVDDLHYLFICADGRTKSSKGVSLYEMAKFLKNYNVNFAYNLDGGGSSTMVFNGKVVNKPINSGKIRERKVSDIVYIGY